MFVVVVVAKLKLWKSKNECLAIPISINNFHPQLHPPPLTTLNSTTPSLPFFYRRRWPTSPLVSCDWPSSRTSGARPLTTAQIRCARPSPSRRCSRCVEMCEEVCVMCIWVGVRGFLCVCVCVCVVYCMVSVKVNVCEFAVLSLNAIMVVVLTWQSTQDTFAHQHILHFNLFSGVFPECEERASWQAGHDAGGVQGPLAARQAAAGALRGLPGRRTRCLLRQHRHGE